MGILFILVLGIAAGGDLAGRGARRVSREPFLYRWLSGDLALFVITFAMAWRGFRWTYKTVAQIRESRGLAPDDQATRASRPDQADPLVEDRGAFDCGRVRGQPVVRTTR